MNLGRNMFTEEKLHRDETPKNTMHSPEKFADFDTHMQNMNKQKETEAIIEVMGQHFDLDEPYQPRQFSEEEMGQFFPHRRPEKIWLDSWQDPRQAFGFLQYAENNVHDYILALHPDLIYEDDDGKPHMQPTIDIDGKVYVAKRQPQTENDTMGAQSAPNSSTNQPNDLQQATIFHFGDTDQPPNAA